MTLLNEADAIYIGDTAADRVYLGANLVWEAGGVTPGPTGPDVWLITSMTPGGDRNDFTGEVGLRLGIGAAPITFTWVGARRHHAGGLRTVKLYEWFTSELLLTATIDYDTVADGEFVWTAVPETTLAANGYYSLTMVVTAYDGNIWTNPGPVAMSGMANVYDVYKSGGTFGTGSPNSTFIGLDLGWNVPEVPPLPVGSGLAVHHDAYALSLADGASVTSWPNLGSGPQATIVGTPPVFKTGVTPTSLPVVRFSSSGGGLRGNVSSVYAGGYPMRYTYTMIYVARWVGPTGGRCFTAPYPEGSNFLVGYHTSGFDCVHDIYGWAVSPTAFGTPPGPWRMYGITSEASVGWRTFFNGVDKIGLVNLPGELNYLYNLNGYQLAGGGETGDFDVCELLIYDRPLPDAERIGIEEYLRTKWGIAPPTLRERRPYQPPDPMPPPLVMPDAI